MMNTTLNRRKKQFPFFFAHAPLHRDEFVQNLLPWLIGVPLSLIIIRIFSL